jgi:hypothetical protein
MTGGFLPCHGEKATILSGLRKTKGQPSLPPPPPTLQWSQKVKFKKLNTSIEEASRKNNNIYELLRPLTNWKKLLLQFRSTFL